MDWEFFFVDSGPIHHRGAFTGMLYAIIALAFIVVYRAGRILNFAQGEVIIFMAYVIWTFFALANLPFPLVIILSFFAALVLGLVIERIIFRPLSASPSGPLSWSPSA